LLLREAQDVKNQQRDAWIEECSFQYGVSYDSYLINDGNRQVFHAENGVGLLGYIRDGKYLHVIGGILAPSAAEKVELIRDFLRASRDWKMKTVLFHNIIAEDLPLFEPFGVESTKCGEEAVVRLKQTSWTGGSYEWVRRQENYCRRKGLVAEEVTDALSPALVTELEHLSREHVKRTTTGKEFSYFAGRLILSDLKRKRVFIAKSQERMEAFIICHPAKAGRLFAIEMYRYRHDAPRGAMPFLWMSALRKFKQEGVAEVSLCMMPFYGCDQKHPNDNAFLRCCNVFWFRHLNGLFNAKGLYLFKSRFRPSGRPMYTVAYPRTTLGSLWSAFQLWELSSILSPAAVIQKVMPK